MVRSIRSVMNTPIGEDTTDDGRCSDGDQDLRVPVPRRGVPSRFGGHRLSLLGALMDGSAFRNMDISGAVKILLGFAALGVIACIGVGLWALYLILTWVF